MLDTLSNGDTNDDFAKDKTISSKNNLENPQNSLEIRPVNNFVNGVRAQLKSLSVPVAMPARKRVQPQNKSE